MTTETRLTLSEVRALRAVQRGDPSEHQCSVALAAIIHKICETWADPYVPGSFDQTAHALGRASVGHELHMYLKRPLKELFPEGDTENE